MRTRATHALAPAEIAAMFAERLAIAPEWEERFASGALLTLLDRRAAEKAKRRPAPLAGFLDDDDDEESSSEDEEMGYARCGGVAVIAVDGPLMQHGGWWFDGHESVRARATAAALDPRVKIAAMRIDSPGGVVAGCFDNVRATRAAFAAAGKTLVVWCGGGGAFSGAYAWACAGSEISVTDTSGCGSVGAISVMSDYTKANEAEGVRRIVVRSGSRKAEGHPDLPKTDAVVVREQAVIDSMAAVFADVVGQSRRMTPDAVLALQGEAFYGDACVSNLLADRVETFDAFLARCVARAEEITMKATAQRLGLAADANEADIMKAIDALEARVATAVASEKKTADELNRVADTLIASARAEALVSGRKTAGQLAADEEIFSEMPKARAAVKMAEAYSKIERAAALPKETKEPSDPPQHQGPSARGKGALLDGAKMTATELSAHYGSADFQRLMNEHVASQRGKLNPGLTDAGGALPAIVRHSIV